MSAIDPCIESQARRHSHLSGPTAHLLKAVLKELDDTRRRFADALVDLDTAQARRCLGGMPRESTTDWANRRLAGGFEPEYEHLDGWKK